jgi:hypothetical protein
MPDAAQNTTLRCINLILISPKQAQFPLLSPGSFKVCSSLAVRLQSCSVLEAPAEVGSSPPTQPPSPAPTRS